MNSLINHFKILKFVLLISCILLHQQIKSESSAAEKFLKELQSLPRGRFSNYTGPFLIPNEINKLQFECKILFEKRGETPVTWPPPKTMPADLIDAYTMGGQVTTRTRYFQEAQNGGKGYHWRSNMIQNFMKRPNTCGHYRNEICDLIIKKFSNRYITGKKGAVIGSQTPWAEAALFSAGAAHITTIEYMNITTNFTRLSTLTPENTASAYLSNKWEPVDFIFCYSSIEHDGLGRYGDPLNPYADLEAVAKMYCLLKPGGVLFIGFPYGIDTVIWNSHRIYGKIRLAAMLSFWKFIFMDGSLSDQSGKNAQPIFVLQKVENLRESDVAMNQRTPPQLDL